MRRFDIRTGIRLLFLTVVFAFFSAGTVSAKGLTLNLTGSGQDFGKYSYAYYKVDMPYTELLTIHGVFGFESYDKYTEFLFFYANGIEKKIWEKRYPYRLLDENKKPIDPVGWHKAGKSDYRYFYFLKKGTYYIQVKTGKRKCGTYRVQFKRISDSVKVSADSYKNGGGKKKSKAVKIKSPDKSGYTTHAQLLRNGWHGNYISFALMGSGSKAQSWYKYYSNGKSPLYAVVRLGQVTGKWDMVVYGPSWPGGKTCHLPYQSKIDPRGSADFYKNGKKVQWGNVITLARSNGSNTIGPKKGWYYFKFVKRKVSGKKESYYKKCSICADIYITKKKSLGIDLELLD